MNQVKAGSQHSDQARGFNLGSFVALRVESSAEKATNSKARRVTVAANFEKLVCSQVGFRRYETRIYSSFGSGHRRTCEALSVLSCVLGGKHGQDMTNRRQS